MCRGSRRVLLTGSRRRAAGLPVFAGCLHDGPGWAEFPRPRCCPGSTLAGLGRLYVAPGQNVAAGGWQMSSVTFGWPSSRGRQGVITDAPGSPRITMMRESRVAVCRVRDVLSCPACYLLNSADFVKSLFIQQGFTVSALNPTFDVYLPPHRREVQAHRGTRTEESRFCVGQRDSQLLCGFI